jgi:hypothetical protein
VSSLIWWGAQQLAKQAFVKAAENPGWTSLGFVLVANPATRGFTLDIIKATLWRSAQFTGRLTLDVARAAAARSSTAAAIQSAGTNVLRFAGRHPVATVATLYISGAATSIALAQDPDPLTEQVQVKGVSQGLGGTGQPGVGSWSW